MSQEKTIRTAADPDAEGLDLLPSEPEQQAILDDLDGQAKPVTGPDARQFPRVPYRRTAKFILQIENPGGSPAVSVVKSRNLSRTGIGFLHGQFVRPASACGITLLTIDGQWIRIWGTIVRCRRVSDGVHEVGVKFNQPIDRTKFVDGR